MSSAFSSIKQGLEEAIEFAEGKPSKAVIHEFSPIDIKAIRARLGMSQNEFAAAISVSTLRHWEPRDRSPPEPLENAAGNLASRLTVYFLTQLPHQKPHKRPDLRRHMLARRIHRVDPEGE